MAENKYISISGLWIVALGSTLQSSVATAFTLPYLFP